jgi:hypothetical protein
MLTRRLAPAPLAGFCAFGLLPTLRLRRVVGPCLCGGDDGHAGKCRECGCKSSAHGSVLFAVSLPSVFAPQQCGRSKMSKTAQVPAAAGQFDALRPSVPRGKVADFFAETGNLLKTQA